MTDVRMLLADRSATVRSVLKRALDRFEEISVVGESDDGSEVVALVRKISPDVLVTDLDLVGLGGRELIEAVAAVASLPVFTLIPATRSDHTRVAFATHHLGVVGVHPKPDQPEGWADLGGALGRSILEVCGKPVARTGRLATADEVAMVRRGLRFVGIGASTGGPGALCVLLRALGAGATFGIVAVQHIAEGFETILADWLASETGLDVAVARNREKLLPGIVRFAPAGGHLVVAPDGRLHIDQGSPPVNGHKPSIDVLFRSLVEQPPETVAAIQLTGMGSDGARGLVELRRSGALTVAQEEESCAVFGMPRTAFELGGVTFTLAPAQIGRLLAHASGARS